MAICWIDLHPDSESLAGTQSLRDAAAFPNGFIRALRRPAEAVDAGEMDHLRSGVVYRTDAFPRPPGLQPLGPLYGRLRPHTLELEALQHNAAN